MAGNAVVLKPSEATPFSARLVEEIFSAAGLPEGVFTVVAWRRRDRSGARRSAVSTRFPSRASVATGRKVAEACGRQLVPCTLELGGKDPMIVCADADLACAARGAVYGAFTNSGQACTSTERVYVVDEVADRFTPTVRRRDARTPPGFDRRVRRGCHQLAAADRHDRSAGGRRVAARCDAVGWRPPQPQ